MTGHTRERQAMRLFEAVVDLPADERAALLDEACREDQALRQAVASLLQSDLEADRLSEAVEAEIAGVAQAVIGSPRRDPLGLAGEKLNGRYVIESCLGEGGIGVVYQARDEQLHQRKVVVKVLLEKSVQNPWLRRKFEHESEALTRVDHPNVVKVLDRGMIRNHRPFLVMEFVNGKTLADFLGEPPQLPDQATVAVLILHIGQALQAVHGAGILHRDLKPNNIMLQVLPGGALQVKLIDFGIAKLQEPASGEDTTTPLTVGTLPYMALELLEGKEASVASDVYALGVIAYECLTGQKPFIATSSTQLAQLHEFRDLQKAGLKMGVRVHCPELPASLEPVIHRALASQAADRYQTAQEFSEALAAALDGFPGESTGSNQTGSTTILVPWAAPRSFQGKTRGLLRPKLSRFGLIALALILGIAWALWPVPSVTVSALPSPKAIAAPQMPFTVLNAPTSAQSGQEIRLRVALHQEGYLYLLNESPHPRKDTLPAYTFLFPATKDNRGSARFDPQTLMIPPSDELTGFVFEGTTGTEKLWLVWAKERIPELETIKHLANPQTQGVVRRAEQISALRTFLENQGSGGDPSMIAVKCFTIEHAASPGTNSRKARF